jgi:hypothetical protein
MLVLLGGVLSIVGKLGGVLALFVGSIHSLECVGWLK